MPYSRFLTILALSTLIDATTFAIVFFSPRKPRPGTPPQSPLDLRRFLQALVAAAAVFTLQLPLCWSLGFNFFGLVYLAYLVAFVLIPLGGLVILAVAMLDRRANPRPRVATSVCYAAAIALLMAPLGAYATYVEPHRLKLETPVMPLPPQRSGTSPIRIGILADIQTDHVTEYEVSAVKRLMAERPDIILLPGDLFQNPWTGASGETAAMHDLLCRLNAPAGAYIVPGDVDHSPQFDAMLAGTPVKVLRNTIVRFTANDRRITLGGVELDCFSPAALDTMRQLETAPGDEDIRILLSHRPDAVLELARHSRIDLVVSGHTHGGQVVIPWFGPPITLSRVPRDIARGGLHDFNGDNIYISRGVGSERGQSPMLRLNCPPEITLLTLDRLP
ncbi:MAG TPA: metallophosphoesterase [Phycisphaerae bacterium]|nr:metallophosphoesterase [Phycisphaerae bacterium]